MQLWGLLLWLRAVEVVSIQQLFPAGFRSGLALAKWRWDKRTFAHTPRQARRCE